MESGVLWLWLGLLVSLVKSESVTNHEEEKRQSANFNTPLVIANWCAEDIYPALLTQGGDGPSTNGFHLAPGTNQTVNVTSDWQGRVWGRTNCTFSSNGHSTGSACSTGDCGGSVNCAIAGAPPATLAEFTFEGSHNQTFYDLSLVDGYNLPMAIVVIPNGNSQIQAIPGSQTNPSCVASVGDVASPNFNPYSGGQQFLGTSAQKPLAFEDQQTASDIADWCPWDLQVDAPLAPGNGIYPYPDGNVQRPAFDPCLSACAKYNQDNYCCTGSYDSPSSCGPNYYSKAAKNVCPDAYSYAYDDQDSTFIIPQGGGFQVIFCPGGRSTNIIATRKGQTSGSSSSGSTFVLRVGWLLIDGRALKAALASVLVLTLMA